MILISTFIEVEEQEGQDRKELASVWLLIERNNRSVELKEQPILP